MSFFKKLPGVSLIRGIMGKDGAPTSPIDPRNQGNVGMSNHLTAAQAAGSNITDVGGGSYYDPKAGGMVSSEIESPLVSRMGKSFSTLFDQAHADGDMKWTALARERNQNQLQQGLGQLGAAGQSQLAGGLSQMAMRGGVGAGARERMANQTNMQNMLQTQNMLAGSQDRDLGLSQSDAQARIGILGQLGGVEQGLQERNQAALAARRTSQMMPQGGGGKGGLLGSIGRSIGRGLGISR